MYLPKPDGGPFETCPQGTHLAICYRFIDLGTQRYQHPGGPRDQHKVMISWELPEQLMAEGEFAGQPFTFHQQYTWSMNENATLRKHLESWRGIPFKQEDFGAGGCDIRDILGKTCMLSLGHNSSGYRTSVRLIAISRTKKGMKPPDTPFNPIEYFTLGEQRVDLLTFSRLSEKLQATISRSPEFKKLTRPVAVRPWLANLNFCASPVYPPASSNEAQPLPSRQSIQASREPGHRPS